MPKELVISAAPHETRVAILEDGQLCEIYIEREKEYALVGSIYKGRVTRVLPGMQSAFVDIGLDSDAFLYVGDFLEHLEDYDHVTAAVEGKVEHMEQQGGEVFPQPEAQVPVAEEPSAAPAPEMLEQQPPAEPTPGSVEPTEPPRRPFGRSDQGQGRFGRGRGFDRGRRRRGGRWRRGRGPDRQQGRDLPPSKYASPHPPAPRPYQPPAEEPPADYEPVILPGESLAKYKNRVPAAPSAEPAAGSAPAPAASEPQAEALPPALYAVPGAPAEPDVTQEEESPAATPSESASEPAPPTGDAEAFREYQALPEEPPRSLPTARHEQAAPPTDSKSESSLSDEEVNSLAEQLAEARQEESTDEAQGDSGMDEEDEPNGNRAEDSGNGNVRDPGRDDVGEMAARAAEEGGGEIGPEDAENADSAQPPQQQPTSARVSERQRARFQRPMRRGGRHRGQRHMRNDRRPAPQRRPQLISEMLKSGQEIVVQIAKEPLGKKGARITSHIALPGRFLVYMPTVNHIGVSRRIASAEERSRLRHLVTDSKGTFPGGFIVRTAAEGAPDDEIRSDVEFLGRTWDKIRSQSEPRRAPALLHRDLNLVERILRDYVSNEYTAIWIDNEEEFSKVVEFVSRFQPRLVGRVKLFTKPAPIFEEFGIQQELDRALRPKVWLKSGGYIVINHTEALVAIDVNTGKYVGRGSTRLEDTIVKTNLEAVKEIIRQIRLRDLGGIIVLDFIDMEERRNRDKVMGALDAALRADRAPSKVLGFNEFGLVAITRKRTKQALERVLGQPCPYCSGSGMVKSVPTICYEIQSEARKMSADLDVSSITLRVHPEIAKALKTREAVLVEELEQNTRKSVIIQADPTLHWEQYDIY